MFSLVEIFQRPTILKRFKIPGERIFSELVQMSRESQLARNVTCTTRLTLAADGQLNAGINRRNFWFAGIPRKCSTSRRPSINRSINRSTDRSINRSIRSSNSEPRIPQRRSKAEFKVVQRPT